MAQLALLVSRNIARFFHFSLETEFNALRFINYTLPRLCSTYAVATITMLKNRDSLRLFIMRGIGKTNLGCISFSKVARDSYRFLSDKSLEKL